MCSVVVYAQDKSLSFEQKAKIAMDYHPLNMPNDEVDMGFAGIHFEMELMKHFYGGLAIYGAVHGDRGGFFTLGFDANYQNKIGKYFMYDFGFHFGGGGGASAPDGGGAFMLPHANVGVDFNRFSLTTGYSYCNFFDHGLIKSHQWNVALKMPLTFAYTDFNRRGEVLENTSKDYPFWNTTASELEYKLHLNNLYNRRGNLVGETIHLVGLEILRHGENLSLFFKADGAYHGIKAGYMDILFGVGKKFDFLKDRFRFTPKVGLGGGGGGGLNTFGGLFTYGSAELSLRVTPTLRLFGDLGVLATPKFDFLSTNYGFGLSYNVFQNGNYYPHQKVNFSQASSFKGLEAILTQEFYPGAQRVTNKRVDMYQIGFQMNFYLRPWLFLGGQTSFANFGDAGAYAEGIAGAGIRFNPILKDKLSFHLQMLGGAAGGGGISTGQGLIVKPSGGASWKVNSKFSAQLNAGYVKALGGELNTGFVNVGVAYNFSLLFNRH